MQISILLNKYLFCWVLVLFIIFFNMEINTTKWYLDTKWNYLPFQLLFKTQRVIRLDFSTSRRRSFPAYRRDRLVFINFWYIIYIDTGELWYKSCGVFLFIEKNNACTYYKKHFICKKRSLHTRRAKTAFKFSQNHFTHLSIQRKYIDWYIYIKTI